MSAVTLDGDERTVPASAVDELAGKLRGELVLPGPDYDESHEIWNAMWSRRPALVARCAGAADVIDAVRFGREHDLLTAIRGGGHSVPGFSSLDRGLVIDLSRMRAVDVEPRRRAVRAQGGATWGDVDRESQAFGLAVPGGVVSTTGVAGLTLNGGFGWLRRRDGLTIDRLRAASLVTADGELVRASADERSDLFWGLRGGGGNFGIVASFEFEAKETGPVVYLLTVAYPAERANEVLAGWRDFLASSPDELTSLALIWTLPELELFPGDVHGRDVVMLTAMYSGDVEEGEKLLRPLRALGSTVIDSSGPVPYIAAQQLFDPFLAKGAWRGYAKGLYVDSLGDEVLDAFVEDSIVRPAKNGFVLIWQLGGAMGRVGAAETAFGRRDAPFLVSFDLFWKDAGQDEESIGWAREMWKRMHRFSFGGLYLNFAGFGEEKQDLVRAAYGDNYRRLVELKKRYDPHNFFRLNQNIDPAGM